MTSALIRPATADDAPVCAAILKAWIDRTDWMTDTISKAELEQILRAGLPLREAYVSGSPVRGYLSLEAETAHIWGFYVATPRQGLGRALLARAKQGRDYLQLNTHAPNLAAHAFYESQGFLKTGNPSMGSDGVDEIRMEWRR